MNLNYDKIRAKVEHGGNHWTSYSDLFLVLSVVFLLLYVVANLRSSTMSLATANQVQAARKEAEELRKQIKVYEVLKDDYVKQGASQDEIQVYQQLMGQLNLLEGDAKKERNELFKQAKAAEQKEQNLNEYQALVKNIINANLVAQSKLKKRDETIEEKQFLITQQEKDIGDLNTSVKQGQQEIEKNNQEISGIQSKLAQQIQEVQYAYRSKKRSQAKMDEDIAKLRKQSEEQIQGLQSENTQYMGQLQETRGKLEEKNRQAEQLLTSLNDKEGQFKNAISELDRAHADALAKEKQGYEEGMHKAELTADAKLKQEGEYRAAVERKNALYNEKLKSLNGELEATRGSIKDIQGKYQGSIDSLERTNNALQENLNASIAKQNEMKRLAEQIKRNFAGAGINADIDPKTGDVTINFAGEYFDSGSADLKNGMRSILEKMIPVYAKSLFEDAKVVKRIGSVEIVGFASPTYKGKYINPDSLDQQNRQAVNFNMDLSYQRAKSIFEHTFDTSKMQFPHQKDLLPLVKVSGRSYLATDKLMGRSPTNNKGDQYCDMFDCKKSQKVIIKFNLRDE